MKTKINTLHKILTLGAFLSVITLINISLAQPGFGYTPATPFTASAPTVTKEKDNAKENRTEVKEMSTSTKQMLNTRTYWIDYLKQEATTESGQDQLQTDQESPSVKEMETDPNFWPKYIRSMIHDDSSSEVQKMENDPCYWINYLQTTISSQDQV